MQGIPKGKIIIATVAGLVIIAGVIVVYTIITQSVKSDTYASVNACDVLTKSAAQSLLGSTITKPDESQSNTSTTDLAVSNCTYMTKANPSQSIPKTSGVSVLARIARTSEGAKSNKDQFAPGPSDAQAVTGIGDAAYYAPSFRQLNVLEGNNWYIVTYYKDSITNASLTSDKQLAAKLEFK
jgi:hypothetical protein